MLAWVGGSWASPFLPPFSSSAPSVDPAFPRTSRTPMISTSNRSRYGVSKTAPKRPQVTAHDHLHVEDSTSVIGFVPERYPRRLDFHRRSHAERLYPTRAITMLSTSTVGFLVSLLPMFWGKSLLHSRGRVQLQLSVRGTDAWRVSTVRGIRFFMAARIRLATMTVDDRPDVCTEPNDVSLTPVAAFSPLLARTQVALAPVEPIASDCLKFIVVRAGRGRLFSEFGALHQHGRRSDSGREHSLRG